MSFSKYSTEEFTQVLASKAAVPGGGGASALVGAIGISLGNMVGSLTVGKKKYADVEADILFLMERGEKLRQELLRLMDKDAEAFAPLAEAYSIPKEDPKREEVMEKALTAASQVPLEIMRTVCKALELIEEFSKKGSALAISDAGVAAVCCKGALQGAALNVFINTKSMKDSSLSEGLEREVDEMLRTYVPMAEKIYEGVMERIR
jgi:formiminotetrahydrofolate cyclodeaminase